VAKLQRQKKLVADSLGLNERICKLVDTDISDVPTPRSSGDWLLRAHKPMGRWGARCKVFAERPLAQRTPLSLLNYCHSARMGSRVGTFLKTRAGGNGSRCMPHVSPPLPLTRSRWCLFFPCCSVAPAGFRTKSTVGIMLNDCTVENIVVGGPAFISRAVANGDTILKIDGNTATPGTALLVNDGALRLNPKPCLDRSVECSASAPPNMCDNIVCADNILQHLVGSDVPGSQVVLDIQKKSGGQTQVKLKRMTTALIAPKLKLFDLFTQTKDRAINLKDKNMMDLIEGCINTWTEMTIADGEREEKMKSNAARVRTEGVQQCGELETNLKSMKDLTADLMASFGTMRKREALLGAEVEEARRKLLGMQDLESKLYDANARIKELELALRKAESLNASLTKEIDETQAREVKLKGDYMTASKELQDARGKLLELERKLEQAKKFNIKLDTDLARKDLELEEAASRYKKLDVDLRAARARNSDLEFEKSKLEALLKEAKETLNTSEDKRNRCASELEEVKKNLLAKEKECLDTRDERDQLGLDVQRLDGKVKEVEKSLRQIIDDKSEKISQLQVEVDLAKKEETALQIALVNERTAKNAVELAKERLHGQKCAIETELEGNAVRIKTLEQQLKEAVTGKVHYQSETSMLVPAKDDLQRKLIAAEIDLSARKEEVERVTKANVAVRLDLESEKTSREEALKCLAKLEEDQRQAAQELRIAKSDLAQCNSELSTSRALAKSYEDKLAAANVELDKRASELRQSVLKCDALELSARDLKDRLAGANNTVKEQKDEISTLADKIEHSECESRKIRAEVDALRLKVHEGAEREKGLHQEIDELKKSLNAEIKQNAETHSSLVKEQASTRCLERELGDSRVEGSKAQRSLRTVEELEKEHVKKIADMGLELTTIRATMKQEEAELMQIITIARLAVEQMHHAVFPATQMSYANVETKALISKLQSDACAEAQELHNTIYRLQQRNETLSTKLAEVEEIRVQIQNVTHAKKKVEMELADANTSIEKLQDELSRSNDKIGTLEGKLKAALQQCGVSDKKVQGLQADLDSTIERNREEMKKLQDEIAHLKEILGDNRKLAEELQRSEEENDTFKRILKSSLEAQELTYHALCGDKGNSAAGLGLVLQVANGITKVKAVIPGGSASNGHMPLRSGDIIERVDDKTLAGATIAAVQDMIAGPLGSAVNLTFLRSAKPTPRLSTVSVAESPRLMVTLQREATATNIDAIKQRARDMVATAEALRGRCDGLEENVTNLSSTVDRKDVDLTSLRSAREEAVKLINALEQRVRSRDVEIEALRAEALQAKNKLNTANLDIESLTLHKKKADEAIAFSQQRIKGLEEANERLEARKKDLSENVVHFEAEVERLRAALRDAEELGRNAAECRRQLGVAERRAVSLAEQLRMMKDAHALSERQLKDEQEQHSKAEAELLHMIALNRELLDTMKGHKEDWQGVGITVKVGKAVTVKDINSSGSAAHSGLLQVGDTLTECNGKPLNGLSSAQVQNLILGRSGTQVRFKVRPQTGKAFSLSLVRGDGGSSSFPEELREAINCVDSMSVETSTMRELLQRILSQIRMREGDVDRTLITVEQGIEDARLSWLDVSSSVHTFSVGDSSTRKSIGGDGGETNPSADRTSKGDDVCRSSGRLDATTGTEVENGTQKSRASLARVTDLTLECLRQITDLIKMRAQLKDSLAKENRIRLAHEDDIEKLKAELTLSNTKLEHTLKNYNDLLRDRAESIDFEAKIHAILRGKEVELVGVGMVVKLEGRSAYPVIKSITPGGDAAQCTEFCVGDAILTVNGTDVEGMDAHHLTPLFLGSVGSSLTIVAARPPETKRTSSSSVGWLSQSSSRTNLSSLMVHSYTVTLTRGTVVSSYDMSILKRSRPESLELARRDQGQGEISRLRADLELRNQQIVSLADSLEKCKHELSEKTRRANSLEKELREATARFERELKEALAQASKEREDLRKKLERAQEELDKAHELKLALAQAIKRAIIAETECEDLRKKLQRAYEELDDAQATIQGMQTRLDDATGKLQIVEKNLETSEAEKKHLLLQGKDVGELRAELKLRNQQIVSLTDSLETCREELSEAKQRASSLDKELREATARFERELKEATARFERELKEALAQANKGANIAESECEDLRRKLQHAYEELDVAQATIQGMQTRLDDATEKLQIAEKNLRTSEAEKKRLAKELEVALSSMERVLALNKKADTHIIDLQAQVVAKGDKIREVQYQLDLCPYKCKKVEAPVPVPLQPEPEPEEDPTKYVGVGMVVRVETGKPFPLIKKITPGGSAAECPSLAIDDVLLEVDGKDCRGKSVADMTALFLGPVGSSVVVKGHSLADHEHSPDQPSYTVTLIRGNKGQSPLKQAASKTTPLPPTAAGPVQTNPDDERLKRSIEEVSELSKQLAVARKQSEDVACRCVALEDDARKAKLQQQQREASLASGETQQALIAVTAEVETLQEQLEQKTKHLEDEIREHSALKQAARTAQDEAATAKNQLKAAEEELAALRKRVRDMDANLKAAGEAQSAAGQYQEQELKTVMASLNAAEDELTKLRKVR
jgi:C-terminal processing protease CtpA/Prc/predicted  nucleic acid-binding Zn-ribbon protein